MLMRTFNIDAVVHSKVMVILTKTFNTKRLARPQPVQPVQQQEQGVQQEQGNDNDAPAPRYEQSMLEASPPTYEAAAGTQEGSHVKGGVSFRTSVLTV